MIENLPEWAKKKFQERLAVVLEYAAAIDRAEKEHRQAGTRFYRRPFTNEFAGAIGRNPGTVYRWLSTYIKEGEEGLIPGYGKNKGKTIIKTHLAHLIDHLIVPSRPDQEIIAEFLKACDAADEKSPCKATIQTYIKAKREAERRPYAPPKVESRAELLEKVSHLQEEIETLRSENIRLKGNNV